MRAAIVCMAAALALAGRAAQPVPGSALTGAPVDHVVAPGESVAVLAAWFGVDAGVIARRNGLDPGTTLKAGVTLRIDAIHVVPASTRAIVVNVPQRMLFVRTAGGARAFPVAVGRPGWQTPLGPFTVETKEENPTWDVPVSLQNEMRQAGKPVRTRVLPSPDNPLGAFWLGLSLPSIGIHGTNEPRSIHRFATHGCIRVHPGLIGELFALVPEGADGEIVYEPLLVAVDGERTYVEVNPDPYGRSPVTLAHLREAAERAGASSLIDWTLAAQAVALREGVAVDVTASRF